MPLQIVRQDITKMFVDAVVNTTNEEMTGYSGVDYAVHTAAGSALDRECSALPPLETGHAVITGGYGLPAKYIIHTSGPVWEGGYKGESDILKSCYTESLRLAAEKGCESVAFPLISAGNYGFPKDRVLKLAVEVITGFLFESDCDLTVYLCVFDRTSYEFSKKLFAEISEAIDDGYVEEKNREYLSCDTEELFCPPENEAGISPEVTVPDGFPGAVPSPHSENNAGFFKERPTFKRAPGEKRTARSKKPAGIFGAFSSAKECAPLCAEEILPEESAAGESLEEYLKKKDKPFALRLFDLIDEKGMTEVECYKKANIDRKTFSKIRSNPMTYKPSKETAVAFAVALKLDLDETQDFLATAGLTLSRSLTFDKIIRFFIQKKNYDIFEINQALFEFDQKCLGAIA